MAFRAHLLATVCSLALLPSLASPVAAQEGAIAVLLDQAGYWRGQNRPDRAAVTLDRLLAAEPNHLDGLAAAAATQAELGNPAGAERHLARLRELAPADPRLAEAALAVRGASLDPAQLAEARRLAQQGLAVESVALYRKLFGGPVPPAAFAIEYYQTLAGTPDGHAEAREAVAALVAKSPTDRRLPLALARIMTYREASRAEGIRRLQALAQQAEGAGDARAAWRDALQWEALAPEAAAGIEAYLKLYPNDPLMQQRLADARRAVGDGGAARLRGFAALNAGLLADAAREFQAVLVLRPEDADARGGLGLARLRQGRRLEATALLREAIAADPANGRARWARALEGAAGPTLVAQARQAVQRSQFDQAEQILRRGLRREGAERVEAETLLADLALRRGDLAGAEQHYRAALARRPELATPMAGLFEALQRQGRFAEAQQLAERRNRLVLGSAAAQRAEALRIEAQRAGDAESAVALLRNALAVEPANPWLRLDLARALAAQGQGVEARALVDQPAETGSAEAVFAAALFASDEGRMLDVVGLLERVPDRLRSADMGRLMRRARLQQQVAAALEPDAFGHRGEAKRRLLSLAARPEPSGETAALVVEALAGLGDAQAATEAAQAALSANRSAPASGRLAIAMALQEAGLDQPASQIAVELAQDGRLSTDERRQLAGLRAAGSPAPAAVAQRPAPQPAAPQPVATAPQRAEAPRLAFQLYQGARDAREAQRLAEGVLRRDPRNLEARAGAVDAAILLDQWARAEGLLAEARALAPNDPRLSMIEARLARAGGDEARARGALLLAAEQRRGQIGGGETYAEAGGEGARRVALAGQGMASQGAPIIGMPGGSYPATPEAQAAAPQAPLTYPPVAPPPGSPNYAGPSYGAAPAAPAQPTYAQPGYAQPSYAQGRPVATYQAPLTLPPQAANDPLLNQINRELAVVQDENSSRFSPTANFRTRSGDGGFDKLTEYGGGAEVSAALPEVGGRIALRAQVVNIDAGDMDRSASSLSRFGSNALSINNGSALSAAQAAAAAPRQTSATGVSLGIGYSQGIFSADIGSTPLGFRNQNVIGGIEVAPQLSDSLRLRMTAERRAVTDTLLSWGGMRDPSTGRSFGGVVRNTGRGQLEYGYSADTNFYVAGAYSTMEGDGVRDNSRWEAAAGVSTALYRRESWEVTTGLDMLYQSYDRNLRYFSAGHGGYFSPQSFFAASVPIDYRARSGDFSYRLGASAGIASFREDRAPYFPNDGAAQASLEAQAAANSNVTAFYPGQSQTGFTGGVRADVEYAVTPNLRLGAALRYDRSADWSEARGLLYARYKLDQ
ncbi:cellulose biosynthesis protein BcsC [Roseomonas sp. USHLN139]|uniref:cellulose biosynthesis protein BcsC n=1 Tax=Roseomonas sp. USHLN139 TaxID=3081298 RepID=UPI003B02042B